MIHVVPRLVLIAALWPSRSFLHALSLAPGSVVSRSSSLSTAEDSQKEKLSSHTSEIIEIESNDRDEARTKGSPDSGRPDGINVPRMQPDDKQQFMQNAAGVVPGPAEEDVSAGPAREYQCASEYAEPTLGCKSCNMEKTCACDGVVRFGYGGRWTPFINATSAAPVSCEASSFGMDPYEGHGKVCMCRPKVFTCATEYSVPTAGCNDCNKSKTCACTGYVRFGYGTTFSAWKPVVKSVQCESAEFGDPFSGQGKMCQCQPLDLLADIPSGLDMWSGSLHMPSNIVLKSVLAVTLTYFAVYLALATVRTYNQMTRAHLGPSPYEKVLQSAAASCVYFAPVLCATFLATTKRADVLTGGEATQYGLPPYWLKCCILVCSIAFSVQAFAYLIAEWCALSVLERVSDRDAAFGQPLDVVQALPRGQGAAVRQWRRVCNAATMAMYISLGLSILGIVGMDEPDEVTDSVGIVPMSSGVVCTLTLSIFYMIVYLVLHVFRGQSSMAIAQGEASPSFGLEIMKLASTAMNFAPMLSILFIGTQTAMDWSGLALPERANKWMYICTGSVLLQALLVALAPMLAGAELQVVGGTVDFVTHSNDVFVLLSLVRWAAMVAMYYGVGVLCFSLREVGEGWAAMRAVDRFGGLYFAAYLALWLAITLRQFSKGGYDRAIKILSVAKDTVVFCPMLAALFFESFVQARDITNSRGQPGQPQAFAQDAMAVAFTALAVQLFMILCAGFFAPTLMGEKPRDGSKQAAQPVFLLGFHVAMGFLYVSVAIVGYSIFTINSNNATGAGAWFA